MNRTQWFEQLRLTNAQIVTRLDAEQFDALHQLAEQQQQVIEAIFNSEDSAFSVSENAALHATLALNEAVAATMETEKTRLFHHQLDIKKANQAGLHYQQTEQL